MLEIIVNGQPLDLPADIQVSLIIENPFMLKDRIPTPYSLSFSLPPTPRNLKVFNYPNRVTTYQVNASETKELPCTIFFQGIKVSSGIIVVSQFNQNIEASFKGAEINENVRLPFASTEMGQYNFTGGDYSNPNFEQPNTYAYKYKQWATYASLGNDPHFIVAPIRVKTDMEAIEFIHYDTSKGGATITNSPPFRLMNSQYINFYNPARNDLMLERLDPGTGNRYRHASVFPFIRVWHALTTLFNGKLENNIFTQGELQDLVIPSSYFDSWQVFDKYPAQMGMMFNNEPPFFPSLGPNGVTPGNPYLKLNSFLPSTIASEFIKQLLSLFGATLTTENGKFKILSNDYIIAKEPTDNWDNKLIRKLSISIQKKEVYKYGYDGEGVYSAKEEPRVFNSIKQMVDENINMSNKTEDVRVYHIVSTKQYIERKTTKEEIEYRPDSGSPLVTVTLIKTFYKVLINGFGGLKDEDIKGDVYDVSSKLKPLSMAPEQYWWTTEVNSRYPPVSPELAWWFVPKWEGERNVRPEETNIMIFKGMANTFKSGYVYPYLTAYNVDPQGNNYKTLTLSWDGENGLLNRFHKGYKEWIEKDKVKVSGAFLLTALDLHRLDITEKKHLQGRNFFIEKIQVTFRHNRIDPAVIDFIEA